MSKMCPGCREIIDMASPKCTKCGLRFFKVAGNASSLSATCLRLGSAAVALAIIMIAVIRLA